MQDTVILELMMVNPFIFPADLVNAVFTPLILLTVSNIQHSQLQQVVVKCYSRFRLVAICAVQSLIIAGSLLVIVTNIIIKFVILFVCSFS